MTTLKRSALLPLSILALPLTAALGAQGVPLAVEDDLIEGAGPVNYVYDVDLTVDGRWLAHLDTNFQSSQDRVILTNTGTILQEGQALPSPMGASIGTIEEYDTNLADDLAAICTIAGVPAGLGSQGVLRNGELLVRTGDLTQAAGFGPGTIWTYFYEVEVNDSDQVQLLVSVDDPAVPGTIERALVRLDLDGGGQIMSETVIRKVGDTVTGSPVPIGGFWTSDNNLALGENGDSLWMAYLGGNSHGVVVLNGDIIVESGTESPVANHSWNGIGGASSVAMAPNGDMAYTGSIHGASISGHLIVKNGSAFQWEGKTLPDISPYVLTEFENVAIKMTDDGRIAWYGEWSDPDTGRNSGIFLDDQLVVQEGVTQVGDSVVQEFEDIHYAMDVAADGQSLIFEATLVDGTEGAFLFSMGELGSRFCSALPNAVSVDGTRLTATGSTSVAANDLVLSAGPMQPAKPGVFIYGSAQNNGGLGSPFGDGLLCVGGGIVRIATVVSNGSGVMSHAVDHPTSLIAAGDKLHFQTWFRDQGGPGGSGFNLSDALTLVFVP
jgi:hypothetical protein